MRSTALAVQNDQCHHRAGDGSVETHRLRRDLELAAYCNGDVTLTLSKVAVPRTPALWEFVNRPMVTGPVNEIVVAPTGVQVVPSAEENAVMVFPVRVSLSQAFGKV